MSEIIFTNTGLEKLLIKQKVIISGFPEELFIFRENRTWESMDGNRRIVKNISNDHLENILLYLSNRERISDQNLIEFFTMEREYRLLNNIVVPEYEK